MSEAPQSTNVVEAQTIAPRRIDASCRVPLLVLFLSAALWLVIGWVFALIASIKFHAPTFLADIPWLTYGRIHPASRDSVVYGFCLPAGLGIALWLFARLGRTTLAQRWLATLGAAIWNLGVTIGVLRVLAGAGAGFEDLEIPWHPAVLLFVGYLLLGISAMLTFHQRRERPLFVSQWFLFTALFWFPWIYSTATLLVTLFPVRGVAQAVLAWWFSNNLRTVWLGLAGLATIFYFVPKLTGRELHSHYLALFAYWVLVLFGSWAGIPNSAPVPAWMPSVSNVGTVLLMLALIAVALNVYGTTGRFALFSVANTPLSFVLFGTASFLIAGLMQLAAALPDPTPALNLTWFHLAQTALHTYGFFVMALSGALYYILPRLIGTEPVSAGLMRLHFWLAAAGVVLLCVPLAIGGVLQGLALDNPKLAFLDISRSTLPFLRVSTVGDLLLLVGNALFLANLVGLVARFYLARMRAVYADVTADLFKTAGAKP